MEIEKYVECADLVPLSDEDTRSLGKSNAQAVVATGFVNFTGRSLRIVDRNGAEYELQDLHQYTMKIERGVYITRSITTDRTTDTRASVHSIDQRCLTPSTMDVLGKWAQQRAERPGGCRVTTASRISIDALDQAGGTLYVRELDVVITMLGRHVPICHPFSKEAILAREAEHSLSESQSGLLMSIKINDPRGLSQQRWINLNGHVMAIPTVRDYSMPEGVYIAHPSAGTSRKPTLTKTFMTLQEATTTYRLYTSYEEALSRGDPEATLKEEKQEYTRRLNYDEQKRKLRDELLKERNAELQQSGDFFKVLGVIVTGVLTICAAIIGGRKK